MPLGSWEFFDDRGIRRMLIDGTFWTILAGYAWDGASPKAFFFGRHWGTPDYKCTRAATCWHDAAGQFRHLDPLRKNLSTGKWNKVFRDIIVSEGGKNVGPLYLFGLQVGGPFYQLAKTIAGQRNHGRSERL